MHLQPRYLTLIPSQTVSNFLKKTKIATLNRNHPKTICVVNFSNYLFIMTKSWDDVENFLFGAAIGGLAAIISAVIVGVIIHFWRKRLVSIFNQYSVIRIPS